MKQKQGIAKCKPKLASLPKEGNPNIISVNAQDEWNLDDYNNNAVNGTSEIEQPQKNIQQEIQGDLQNQNAVVPAVEDNTSSFPGPNVAPTSVLKKARSKASKSSKAISSSSTKQISNARNAQIGGTRQRELELPNQDPEYKEEELKVALEVIRKVMKMDAAEPFNVPVDPVAQGIPDYFDIIKKPIDFGTICYNINHGATYKNSKDVMRDVQYIWDNCCRYNRKGHFILELMKRVKKNLIKYWTEAGLCKEQQQEIDEATMRRNSHDSSVDLLDYGFSHPHPRQNPYDIPQSQSSLWRSEPYQIQQCQWHPTSLQPQHSYHQASTFTASTEPPHTTPLTEPTVRGSPHGHWCLGSHHAESCSCSHQNRISQRRECNDHKSSLCCSQPYRPQRDLCPCFQCSGHAGDFHSHRSEQWNVNCTQQEPRNSKRPMTDFTSQRPQAQIPSSCLHKQQPLETCGVDEYFSPPPTESLVTVAKCRPAKYPAVSMTQIVNRELLDEVNQYQTQIDKPDEPQLEFCQGQSSSQPQISPPQASSDMFQAVPNKTKKKSGFRGPTRCLKVFDNEDKIPITTNEVREPIGTEAPKLISFLGVLARNGHVAPLTYVKWRELPEENKEKMWQLVQSKFDINPESKTWALKSLAKKWSSWKASLKVNHYNPHESDEARLADCNERVLPEQWRVLVEFWNSPEAQVVSNKNKANRSHMKFCHTSGTKSFARLREEQRLKRPDGKEPSQADLFILTRTRKNGQPVTETSSRIISQLRDAAQQKQGTSQVDTIENEVFVQVLGEDKRKRKRGQTSKLGPSSLNTLPPEAEKIVSEAKAEVLEMKEKMVAVEQTCAQMAAQMAAMMSMMQKNFAATNASNLDASLYPEESENVSASHYGLRNLERSATKNEKKLSAGKVARRKP